MKALEFNILRMVALMIEEYSFCEAFEKEGFSADVGQLKVLAENDMVSHKAKLALKRIYNMHILNGFDEDIKKYNEVEVTEQKVFFEEQLKVVQLRQELIPDDIQNSLEEEASFKDTNNDIGEYIISLGTVHELYSKASEEQAAFLLELYNRMNFADASYVQIVKI